MIAIQRGATETIFLTARNEQNEIDKKAVANLKLDILIVQQSDETKYIHKRGVVYANEGYVRVDLTTQETSIIVGVANLEVRDSKTQIRIATKTGAFDFRDNVIHTLNVL